MTSAEKETIRDIRTTRRVRVGAFAMGSGLIVCGIVDAAFDPFGFITAPQLLGSGIALVMVGAGLKPPEASNADQ